MINQKQKEAVVLRYLQYHPRKKGTKANAFIPNPSDFILPLTPSPDCSA
jgi:hypothetical protein